MKKITMLGYYMLINSQFLSRP